MYRNLKLVRNLSLSAAIIGLSIVGTTYSSHSNNLTKSSIEIAQANSSISNLDSVGGPLSRELQGKPVVVEIYATWCPACKNLAATKTALQQQYAGRVNFVVLDVTDKAAVKASETKAQQLGLSQFFNVYKAKTGTITIINPATGKILASEKNNTNQSLYTQILDREIARK
jgi:thiol-disulfide isomerase/thioredoxin